MDKWNENDWQGRSKNQVEFSYKSCGTALLAGIIIFILNYIIAWI